MLLIAVMTALVTADGWKRLQQCNAAGNPTSIHLLPMSVIMLPMGCFFTTSQ